MQIADALFPAAQAKVFAQVFGHTDRGFHLNELRRLTGLGSASLQRELNRLTDTGVLRAERVGNLRVFQANPDSPVFDELVSLTRKLFGPETLLKDALLGLTPPVAAACLYGSVAKGEAKANSDVDVMLVGNGLLLSRVLECLLPLESELGRKINPTCFSLAEFAARRAEHDSFVSRVLALGVVPLIGNMHAIGGT
jgi:predicted nucleotidyltransferase